VAPAIIPALADENLDLIDTGPRVPSFDAAPLPRPVLEPEFVAAAEPEPVPFAGKADTEEWDIEQFLAENAPEIAPTEPATPETADEPLPEFASTEGIDLAGLSAEMEAERAELAAVADAVLAEVSGGEIAVADAPSVTPLAEPVPAPKPAPKPDSPKAASPASVEHIASYTPSRAPRPAARRLRPRAMPGLAAVIVALAAANAILVAWRSDIVRLMPQTASLYGAVGVPVNLRGLAFENMKMSKGEHEGVDVLVVDGSIVNVTGRAVEVPRLRLAVRNESKNEIYSWTAQPARTLLGPGETLPFRSRLASPPAETRDVLVRFFSRRDVIAGLN
jgi:hypothetical protein